MSEASRTEGVKNIVLVHGGFVDGSGWQGVYDHLKKDGYLFLDRTKFRASFAADVSAELAPEAHAFHYCSRRDEVRLNLSIQAVAQ